MSNDGSAPKHKFRELQVKQLPSKNGSLIFVVNKFRTNVIISKADGTTCPKAIAL